MPCSSHLNQNRNLNGERIALSADNNSSYPGVQTHAILRLNRNDRISAGSGGTTFSGTFNTSNDKLQYQTFEGFLLRPN